MNKFFIDGRFGERRINIFIQGVQGIGKTTILKPALEKALNGLGLSINVLTTSAPVYTFTDDLCDIDDRTKSIITNGKEYVSMKSSFLKKATKAMLRLGEIELMKVDSSHA